jgi:hypothetical protein
LPNNCAGARKFGQPGARLAERHGIVLTGKDKTSVRRGSYKIGPLVGICAIGVQVLKDIISAGRDSDYPCASEKATATIPLITAIGPGCDQCAVRELGYRLSPLVALIELIERDAPNFVEWARTGSGCRIGFGAGLRANWCGLLTGDAPRGHHDKERYNNEVSAFHDPLPLSINSLLSSVCGIMFVKD